MRAPFTLMLRPGVAALCLAAAGCALNPPPDRSQLAKDALGTVVLPPAWRGPAGASGPVAGSWVKTFEEPRMHELVNEALARNTDLRAAAARVDQAQAQLKVAAGALSPAVTLIGRGAEKLSGGGSSDLTGAFITASWEIDVWGRVRYGVRGTEEQFASTQADYEYARQSIAGLVAKGWFIAAEAGLQRDLTRSMIESAVKQAEVARERVRVGVGNELDVALAEASLQTYRDTLRQLELAAEQALRAIEVLAGRYPAAGLEAARQLTPLPAPAPLGIPSGLLERRPDILAAERRVAAAFNYVEQAKAARLPTFSLGAAVNWIESSLFVLKNRENPAAAVSLMGILPLFTGGALEAQVEVRTAEQERAVAEYGAIALKAFNEVESALASEAALGDRQTLLARIVTESERALELSSIQYRVGKVDLRNVLNDQLRLYSARSQVLRVQSERLAQRVNLHLALGGGWSN